MPRLQPVTGRVPISQPGALGEILEEPSLAEIAKQPEAVVDHAGDHQVGPAVVIEVAEIRAHARNRGSVVAQRHARFQADLPKGPIALIAE